MQEHEMLQAAIRDATIVLHCPPDFSLNAEILGICGVSAENSDQYKYGWMVTDFLHWKLLFHTAVSKAAQTWLSSLDIRDFLTSVDGLSVNKDETIHRVIGDKNENKNIIKISSDNEGFVADFLKHVADRARVAAFNKTDLVLLVFSPVTPDGDICVDLSGTKRFLTAEGLHDTITHAVVNTPLSVILVTPSPFTGGWLCRPWFTNISMCPSPDNMMRAIAQSCGGAFAATFIKTFTQSKTTPLMTDSQRAKVKYDDPMPLNPTTQQIECLHVLQRQIHESLEHQLAPLAREHALIFQKPTATGSLDFYDPWAQYALRRGLSMEFWDSQWKAPRSEIDGAHRFEFLGEAFGSNKDSQIFHLRYLAGIELQTYPGDWCVLASKWTNDFLNDFKHKLLPSEEDAKHVFDAMEYFASSVALSQMIAKAFNLPAPDGLKCRYWYDDKSESVENAYSKKFRAAFGELQTLFDRLALLPSEIPHPFKQVRFWRARRWLSAAIALRFEDGSPQDVQDFVQNGMARLVNKLRETQRSLLLEDEAVKHAGRNWLAALGLDSDADRCDAASSLVPEDTEIAEPTAEGFQESGHQNPVLVPKAEEWEVNQADTVSGDGQNDGAPAQVVEVPNTPVAEVPEAEAMVQSDMQQAELRMEREIYRPPHLRLRSEPQDVEVEAAQQMPDTSSAIPDSKPKVDIRNVDWRAPRNLFEEEEPSVAQAAVHSQNQPVDTVVSPPRAADYGAGLGSASRHESSEDDNLQLEKKKSNGPVRSGPTRNTLGGTYGSFAVEARMLAEGAVTELKNLGAVGNDMVESLAGILRDTADRLIRDHCRKDPLSEAGSAATDKMSNNDHGNGEAGGPLKLRGGVSRPNLGASEDGEPWGAHNAEAVATNIKDCNTSLTPSNSQPHLDLLTDDVGSSPAMQSPAASFQHPVEDLLINDDAESSEHLNKSVYVDAPQEPATGPGPTTGSAETEAPLVQLLEDDDFFARAGIKW